MDGVAAPRLPVSAEMAGPSPSERCNGCTPVVASTHLLGVDVLAEPAVERWVFPEFVGRSAVHLGGPSPRVLPRTAIVSTSSRSIRGSGTASTCRGPIIEWSMVSAYDDAILRPVRTSTTHLRAVKTSPTSPRLSEGGPGQWCQRTRTREVVPAAAGFVSERSALVWSAEARCTRASASAPTARIPA